MQLQFDRAERLYREGARLFEGLDPDGRRIFGAMMTVYYHLLQEIRRQPAAVLSRRVALGRLRKTRIMARWLLCPPKCLVLS
jgi:phytoene/squalene synthetase